MMTKLKLLLGVLLFLPAVMYGEGSKQLTPNKSASAMTDPNNDKAGYLAHDANLSGSTASLSFLKPAGFSRNGATYSKDHRLKIRVKAGETLYYGVRRAIHDQTSANQGNLIITMRRTNAGTGVDDAAYSVSSTLTRNTSSTRQMLLTANQNGVIDNATEAENGPNRPSIGGKAAVTAGYTPLSVTNNTATDYDYYVEFTQVGESTMADDQRFSVYDLWDFTVIDATGNEKQGRMRSKLWSFSAGGTSNVFSKNFNMFPLVPAEDQPGKYFVKKLELAGIAPQNYFRFVTNSGGTLAGTTTEDKRKSQTSQQDYPEFENFVNNPDENEWPSAGAPTFSVSIANTCNTTTGGGKTLFTTTTSDRSTLMVLINLNGVAGYQSGTTDVLLEQSSAKGINTLEWNGLNGLGTAVAKNTSLTYSFRNGCAPINFPVWDAEINNGFRVEDVRPVAGSNYNSLLYWDDRNLSTSQFPAPQFELFGAAPTAANTSGLHPWGSTNSGSASYNAGDVKTINTWTYGYTNSQDQTVTFTYDCSADVAVTATAATGPYTIGKPFTYTITAANNGPMPATNVVVNALLNNTKLQFVSASDAAYVSSTGNWNVGSLAVGASRTLTITATPLATGAIATTATQTHTEADNVSGNNSATSNITVVESADIEVKNTVSQSTYNNGATVTYTVTAKNLGPNAATGVVVTDQLPAAFATASIISNPPAGTTYNATTGVWTVGNLAVNETKSLTITAPVSQTGTITTTATLGDRTGYQLDLTSGNNTASNTITVNPASDVAVSVGASSPTANQNGTVIFTVTATNNGPNTATSVNIANQIPAGLTITGSSATAGTFNAATGAWNVGMLISGNPQTLTLTARPTVTGTLTVTSTESHSEYDATAANGTASASVTVAPTADVAVTQSVSAPANGTTYTNESVTYTVTVTNNGPSTATNVNVVDKLPSTVTFTSATTSTGSYTSGTGAWSVGTLTSGASATLTLKGTINQSAVVTNTASQTHTENDNVNGNNSASVSIQSGSGVITADINVLTSANPGPYYTGNPVTFTVRATNQGPDGATNVNLAAQLPTGFTFVSATPKVGSYNQGTGTWTIPALANGSYTELTLIGTPNADLAVISNKNYAFTASTTGTPAQVDNDATDNNSTTNISVLKRAEVGTTISVSGNSAGGLYYHNLTEATFQITVTNNGPDRVTGLVGQDTRTGSINFTSVQAPAGTTYNPATGVWNVGTLDANTSVTLTVKGIPNKTGRINLGGDISAADQHDGNTSNDEARALISVLPVADVVITNTAPATFNNGENVTFTVKAENNGPDAATNLKIQDVLPAGLTLVSATPSTGTYSGGIWTLGTDLLSGAANAQTLTLTVTPQAAATYSNTASVYSVDVYDNVTSNNSQTAQIQGNASADIAVTSNMAAGPYYVGNQYLVTVTATNNGPDAATGVVIGSVVSTGARLVPGSGTPSTGTINPLTGLWTIGNLGLNQSASLTMLVEPIASGTLNNLGYKYASNEYDPNGGTTANGNNSTVISFTVTDRPAVAQVLQTNKHYFFFNTGQHIAEISDPDGALQNVTFVSGTRDGSSLSGIPAGMRLLSNGELEVAHKFSIVSGTYALTIQSVDPHGGTTQNVLNFTISNDWDNDGVTDDIDLDDNNDGIITEIGAVNPTGDDDNDGIYNFLDTDFVHPTYGAFVDSNGDEINDAFDLDLDGLIRGFDIDIDGDGIPNIIEAFGGVDPGPTYYNPLTGTVPGAVSANGIPLAAQTAPNSGVINFPNMDTDGDGRRDYEDIDADNDGILDNIEAQKTSPFISRTLTDGDKDGLDDAYDVTCGCGTNAASGIMPVNFDGMDELDYRDADSDNDDESDFAEAFDDNQNGVSLDDLKARALAFEAAQNKGYYTTADSNGNGVPNWLELVGGKPAFLVFGNAYYFDTNKNGLVDLFDSRNGGRAATLQTLSASNQYAFRTQGIPVALPVSLVKFTGKYQKQAVMLNWETASEINNAYFSIERSANGVNFEAIGKVAGAGTSSTFRSYQFQDNSPLAGTSYYRLKQVDFDGKFEYSSIVAVTATGKSATAESISLYPNPATEQVTLNLNALTSTENLTIDVISMDGKVVTHQQTTGGISPSLQIGHLPAGKYLVKVQGSTFTKTLPLLKL